MVAIAGRVDSQHEVCPSHNGEKPGRRMSAGNNPRKQAGEVQPLALRGLDAVERLGPI
jgi:hypothetical protein